MSGVGLVRGYSQRRTPAQHVASYRLPDPAWRQAERDDGTYDDLRDVDEPDRCDMCDDVVQSGMTRCLRCAYRDVREELPL